MSFAQRVALVLLAAFFLASVATSVIAWICARPLLAAAAATGSATLKARSLALFRLLPSACAAAVTALILIPGYVSHERPGSEEAGVTLWLLASAGAALIAASIAGVAASVRKTARLRRVWLAAARPVAVEGAGISAYALDLSYPLVAVLGVFRPRLFISTQVLRHCPARELAAIVEHELAHVRRRDNLLRLWMDAAPDLLRLTSVPARTAAAWHRAVEHRADEAASRRLDLASALVRVSRMASGSPAFVMPASALYGGGTIDERVRHLLGSHADSAAPLWAIALGAATCIAVMAVAIAAGTGAASGAAHSLLEITVSTLP